MKPFLPLLLLLFNAAGFAAPVASFTANQTSGCSPLNVQFTNSSTGAVSYFWDLGNGNTSTLTNPANLYIAPGSYTISLIATDASGAKDTARYVNYIIVQAKPVADFYSTGPPSCVYNNSFSFTNTSTGATTYLWDFGDGNLSTQPNPVHSYALSGSFTVTLIATNAYGCSDQKTLNQYITVFPQPQATILVDTTASCDPSTVFHFSCNAAGTLTYLWKFGDGTTSTLQNSSHQYSAGGNYDVSLILTNSYGCSDTSTFPTKINVGVINWSGFTAAPKGGCVPLNVNFSSQAPGISNCTWFFGDGTTSTLLSPSHTYSNPGSYTITYIINTTTGCSDTVIQNNLIVAGATPVVNFTYNTIGGCAPLTAQFTNQSNNFDSCEWSFGDGTTSTATNPVHIYSSNGDYTITLKCIGKGGCLASKTVSNMISVSSVKALFSANPRVGCPPLPVSFNDFSIGTQLSYSWDFGDGSTSTQQSPSHTYTSSGVFNVSLIIHNSTGCVDTVVKPAYIQTVNPAANYIPPPPTQGCAPLTAQFTDGTVGTTSWFWNFGDGTTSTLQNPVHAFTAPGTYVVSLTNTSSSGGCAQTIPNFSTFIVHGGYAGFTHTESQCPPYVSNFADTSLNAIAWLWTFDDGTTDTVQNPSHTFAVPGYHDVSLTITTAGGCTYNIMQSNGIYFTPFGANFYGIPQNTSFPTTVDFHANSTGATSWLWDFGDGTTSTLENPSHFYSAGGYTVTLTVSNGMCTSVYSTHAISFGIPDTSSIPVGKPGTTQEQRGCVPLTVNFSQTYRGSVSWHWDFGDGDSSLLQFPSHTYFKTGIYTVILITYDSLGLPSILQMDSIVKVYGPQAHFSYTQVPSCQNTQIILQDSSTGATFWSWIFGDGTSAMSTTQPQIQSHLYTNGLPNYIISLTASDTAGCSSSISTSIFANFISPVIASESEICGTDTVHFSTSLQNYPSYLWDFGDGNTSTLTSPTHVYLSEGHYQVSLTVSDNSGCSQTFYLNPDISVNMPVANFQVSGPNHGCDSLTTSFLNLSVNADGYLWDLGDGNTSTIKEVTHHYSFAGVYNVSLTIFRGNCVSAFTITHAVRVDTAHANFSRVKDGICIPITVTLTDLSTNAVSWNWNFGDGTTSTLQNPVHIYTTSPGNIKLVITDINGCRDSMTMGAISPLSAGFTSSSDSGCTPLTVHFTNSSVMAGGYYWDFGDGSTSTANSPDHTYTKQGSYTVVMVAYPTAGYPYCSDTAQKIIQIKSPFASFHATKLSACAPALIDFIDTSKDADNYLWNFGDSTTSTSNNPSHIYNTPGIYNVSLIVSSNLGCSDTLNMSQYINVLGPITNFTATTTEGCQPLNVVFTDQSINAIDWSWNFGDGASAITTTSHQNLNHLYTDTGTFTATLVTHDTTGCFSFYEYPQKIIIHPQAVAAVSAQNTSGCAPLVVNFTNTSTGAGQFFWDFGDGNTLTDTARSLTHTYTSAGVYTVSMLTANSFGCNDATILATPITVLASPQVSFTSSALQGCSPLYITFTSNVTGILGATYFWDFGNGVTSAASNPVIPFSIQGYYTISLTVSNNNGCSQTITVPSHIVPLDSLPPPITNILSVSVLSNTSIEIQWENNPAIDLGGYVLYRFNNSMGIYENIYVDTNINNTSFTLNPAYIDTGLNTLNNVYTYMLLTFDICRNAIPLSQLNAHSSIDVSSKSGTTGIDVTWNAYGGCPVNSYQIYRCKPGSAWQFLASVPQDSLHYLDSSIVCPDEYSYRITATDLCGNIYTSNSDTSITVPPNIFANQVVDAVRSTVEDNSFVLTEWKQPSVKPDKVVRFDIYRSTDNSNFSFITSVPSYQTDYSDYDVDVQNNHYYYKILVINTCDITEALSENTSTILLKGEMDDVREVHLQWSPYQKWDTGVDYYLIEKQDINGNWQFIKRVYGNAPLRLDYQE